MEGVKLETEVKLKAGSARVARGMLRQAGFVILRPRHFESNLTLDAGGGELRARGELLRVRQAAGETIVTYKGAPLPGKHKSREEIEFVAQGDAAAVFARLGYTPRFRYEKYRTEFRRPGERGVAVLDETPIGVFLELEGSPAWIDRTARRLGYGEKDYILASYGALWAEHSGGAGDFVFPVLESHTQRRRRPSKKK